MGDDAMKKILLVSKSFSSECYSGIDRVAYNTYIHLKRLKLRSQQIRILELERYSGRHSNPVVQYFGWLGQQQANKLAQGYDIIHAMAPDHATVLKMPAKAKIVTWHDMGLYDRYSAASGVYRLKYGFKMRLWEQAYENADVIVNVSTQTMEEVRKQFGSGKPLYVINNCLDDQFLNTRVWRGVRKDFVYVGSIDYINKNFEGMLAFASKIAANGSMAKLHIFTASQIPGVNADNIVFHSNANDAEVMRYLTKAVALVHLATHEGFGLQILEAMACGTPAITLANARIPKETTRYAIKARSISGAAGIAHKLEQRSKPLNGTAIRYAKSFRWANAAKQLTRLYNHVA